MISAKRICQETDLDTWFGSSSHVQLDEEVIGLGGYGYTLTVLSSDGLPIDPEDTKKMKIKNLKKAGHQNLRTGVNPKL